MRSYRLWGSVVLTTVLAFAVAAAGCGGGDKDKKTDGGGGGGGGGGGAGGGAAPKGDLKAVEAKGTGTLKGKVTYNGATPAPQKETFTKDTEVCQQGKDDELVKQNLIVSPNGEVANVVVWLRAPDGQFFNVPEAQRKAADASIDQPHCAFLPHVSTLFPSYFDGDKKKQTPTGQKFVVKNSAPINHNTKWTPGSIASRAGSEIIAKGGQKEIPLKPCPDAKSGEDKVVINCDIHPWMKGYVWVFDHPYAAVTKKDGSYEIKDVPAGAEVNVVYWHESMDNPKVEKKTLNAGDNTFDVKVGP